MPRIYKLSKAGLRLLYKIRHHRGHGIHSPFVFDLITKVIEEKTPYHRYEDIRLHLLKHKDLKCKITKYNRLSFRLANYFGTRNILQIGIENGINTLYLTAPYADAKCCALSVAKDDVVAARQIYEDWNRKIELKENKTLPDTQAKFDCIAINLSKQTQLPEGLDKYIVSVLHEKTFVIVKGIRTNKRTKTLWRSMADIQERTALLDLFNIGIIFFDKSLYRWEYQISF